jgi:nucleotide-binding universal stress UspA family protein
MYKKILVPLDGSELAECVFPHLEAIAKGCNVGSVVFVRVLDIYMPSAALAYLGEEQKREMHDRAEAEAREYLDQLAGRVKLDGIEVHKQLITGEAAENIAEYGKAAESIAEYATENDVDLIIIATHGRSGISRWVWGSVADRILRSACVPVMMVRAPGCVPGI